jgi:hypothetical protein
MEADCYPEMQVSFYLTVWHYVAEDRLHAKLFFCTEIEEQHAETLPLVCSYLNVGALAKTSLQASDPATKKIQTNKLHGLSPRANYTDRATAVCRRSDCQLLRIEGATWSA